MTWLRNIGQDLVDKRLWPIALALVLAIIAAPVVLAGGGGDEETEVAVPLSAQDAGGLRAAVVETAEPGDGPTKGSLRNPFYDAPELEGESQPREGATSSPTASGTAKVGPEQQTASGAKDSGDAAPATGGDGGTSTPAPSTGDQDGGSSKTGTTKGSGETGFDLTIRFGAATEDGKLETHKDIPRLSPLPSADNPMFVYLGVLSDGKTAVFLLGDGVGGGEGDGTCRPSATDCETLELKRGETQFLDSAAGEGGQTAQYQLDVVSVTKRGKAKADTASARKAKSAKAKKAAKAGRAEVRRARRTGAADTLDRYRFDGAAGVIRRLSAKRRAVVRGGKPASGGLVARRGDTVVSGHALLD